LSSIKKNRTYVFEIEVGSGGILKIEHENWTTKVNPLAQKKQNNLWQRDMAIEK